MSAQHYVVGFLFHRSIGYEVALIEKTKPEWQRGRLNGIGGKIELGETPQAAMEREFREETGVFISEWRPFCQLHFRQAIIHFFAAHIEGRRPDLLAMTDEKPDWVEVSNLDRFPIIQNLRWLVPMAIDQDGVTAVVTDLS